MFPLYEEPFQCFRILIIWIVHKEKMIYLGMFTFYMLWKIPPFWISFSHWLLIGFTAQWSHQHRHVCGRQDPLSPPFLPRDGHWKTFPPAYRYFSGHIPGTDRDLNLGLGSLEIESWFCGCPLQLLEEN